jgi:hypothetical protein
MGYMDKVDRSNWTRAMVKAIKNGSDDLLDDDDSQSAIIGKPSDNAAVAAIARAIAKLRRLKGLDQE